MSAQNIGSNFPLMNLSLVQGSTRQQQIQNLTNQIENNKREITQAQNIKKLCEESKECAKTVITEGLKMIDYAQKGIKACEESKEIIKESKEITNKIIANNEKMISIYETLMARNNLQQANSLGNENQNSTKTQIVFADIAYNPPKIDLSKFDTKPLEPQETKKSFNQIAKDYKQFNYSSSIFNDWFSRLRSHSLRFFNGSKF
jgi:predicted O-linked N-acetylglucosamine transferase (SPINDLY family)